MNFVAPFLTGNRGTRQEHSYAILRIAKKMGNPAKYADVARCRDTEKSKINRQN
jgi:hypothetical protein